MNKKGTRIPATCSVEKSRVSSYEDQICNCHPSTITIMASLDRDLDHVPDCIEKKFPDLEGLWLLNGNIRKIENIGSLKKLAFLNLTGNRISPEECKKGRDEHVKINIWCSKQRL